MALPDTSELLCLYHDGVVGVQGYDGGRVRKSDGEVQKEQKIAVDIKGEKEWREAGFQRKESHTGVG